MLCINGLVMCMTRWPVYVVVLAQTKMVPPMKTWVIVLNKTGKLPV